ncbi:hypothetical protein [Caballeronia sp. AZ1_KS37]|uniref:hypothetical protein n=1 Tax=Caballeronia sp. AZ1_KS37 TaxID=2921756 RepID=UPI002028D7CE|nr:hypothetical protein [Caballeronia sp. AZ1_KS37]
MSWFRPRVKAKNEMTQMKMVGPKVVAITLMVAVGATGISAATALASLSANSNATLAATLTAATTRQVKHGDSAEAKAAVENVGARKLEVQGMLDSAATSRPFFLWSMLAFGLSLLLMSAASLKAVRLLMRAPGHGSA